MTAIGAITGVCFAFDPHTNQLTLNGSFVAAPPTSAQGSLVAARSASAMVGGGRAGHMGAGRFELHPLVREKNLFTPTAYPQCVAVLGCPLAQRSQFCDIDTHIWKSSMDYQPTACPQTPTVRCCAGMGRRGRSST